MKTTSLFKAVALVAIMVASVLNSEVKAQDGFINLYFLIVTISIWFSLLSVRRNYLLKSGR